MVLSLQAQRNKALNSNSRPPFLASTSAPSLELDCEIRNIYSPGCSTEYRKCEGTLISYGQELFSFFQQLRFYS